jgi:hypothetical protein
VTVKPFWTEPLTQRDKDLDPDMPCEVGEVPDPEKFRAAGREVSMEAGEPWQGTEDEWFAAATGLDPVPPENRNGMVVIHVESLADLGYSEDDPPARG